MTEAIYIIKMASVDKSNSVYEGNSQVSRTLPSEKRYSASLVKFLGIIHLILGHISIGSAAMAALTEPQVEAYFVGFWTGLGYIGCGIGGLLAASKWYLKDQITWFLGASVIALLCAAMSLALTAFGLQRRSWQLEFLKAESRLYPFHTYYSEDWANNMTSYASTNIMISALFEIAWSTYSVKIALKGVKSKEFSLQEHLQYNREPARRIRINTLLSRSNMYLPRVNNGLMLGQIHGQVDDDCLSQHDRIWEFLDQVDNSSSSSGGSQREADHRNSQGFHFEPTHTFRSVVA